MGLRYSCQSPKSEKIVGQPLTILVVEDNSDDTELLRMAFAEAGMDGPIEFVRDGNRAKAYLSGAAPFEDPSRHPRPDLLVLDLKMPGLSGFEVLQWVAQQKGLKPMVVAILSGSQWPADIDRAYASGADFYFVKPLGFEQLVSVAERLKERCVLRIAAMASAGVAMGKDAVKRQVYAQEE